MNDFSRLYLFLGRRVALFIALNLSVGLAAFVVESSFVFILQGFMVTINLIDRTSTFLPDWFPASPVGSVFLLVLFGFFRACLQFSKNHLGALILQEFMENKRELVLSLGLKNAAMTSTKEVISIFTEMVAQSAHAVASLSSLMSVVITIIALSIFSANIAPREMILGTVLLGFVIFPLVLFRSRIDAVGKGVISEWERIHDHLINGFRNHFFLMVYKKIDQEITYGTSALRKYKNHYLNYSAMGSSISAYPGFIGMVIISCVTFISLEYFETSNLKLVSFFYLFLRVAQAAGEAFSTTSRIRLNWPALLKFYRWSENLSGISKLKESLKTFSVNKRVLSFKLIDLAYGYNESRLVINGINLNLKKGDLIVIKGGSGSGKSTLLALILGVLIPKKGIIEINGIQIEQSFIDFREQLAYSGPEAFLISSSVRENLLYGLWEKSELDDEALWNALERSELRDDIAALPNGLDTCLAEVPQLSTGQKQRLSFARAILREPSLLVLDEATANVDEFTEKKMFENCASIFKRSITIVVTHKNTIDRFSTKIITLGNS